MTTFLNSFYIFVHSTIIIFSSSSIKKVGLSCFPTTKNDTFSSHSSNRHFLFSPTSYLYKSVSKNLHSYIYTFFQSWFISFLIPRLLCHVVSTSDENFYKNLFFVSFLLKNTIVCMYKKQGCIFTSSVLVCPVVWLNELGIIFLAFWTAKRGIRDSDRLLYCKIEIILACLCFAYHV